MQKSVIYPFKPKSTLMLRPGQFWAVPVMNGKYACGRILQLNTSEIPTKSRAFFGGLHDWLGTAPPTSDTIAGAGFVDFGIMHIKAILTTGGTILGSRPLEADKLELPLLLSVYGGNGTMVLSGSAPIREARRDEWGSLPILGIWGYNFIHELAEARLSNRIA